MKTNFARWLGVAVGLFVVAGCGTSAPVEGELLRYGPESAYRVTGSKDARLYWKSLQEADSVSSAMWFSHDLVEHLPNQRFSVNGAEPAALSGGVVVGRVVKVTPGYGYVEVDHSGSGDRNDIVTFDDPEAEWRVARVHIAVDHWFAEGPAPRTVVVGGFVNPPAGDPIGDALVRGLAELGKVIVVLDDDRSYAWDKDVRVVARGGSLLGSIDKAGLIGFPALGTLSKSFVGRATVPVLREAWSRTPPTIKVSVDDGIVRRSAAGAEG